MYKLKVVLNDESEIVLENLNPEVTFETAFFAFQTLYEIYRKNLIEQGVDVKNINHFVVYQPELGYSILTERPDDFKPFMNIGSEVE